MRVAFATATAAAVATTAVLAGCGDQDKATPSPRAYLHPPEAPHLLARVPPPAD